jgi:hypothetical protein
MNFHSVRQRDIDDECIHPAKRFYGLARDPRNEKAEEDQSEKRQNKSNDIRHLLPAPQVASEPHWGVTRCFCVRQAVRD